VENKGNPTLIKKILKFCNDNHWWIVAGILIVSVFFWTYGCQSMTPSLIRPEKKVVRSELIAELNYMVELAKSREEDLDRQDAAKQALIDAAIVMSNTGSVNPAGIINLAATIAAIAFGLNRHQKYKTVAAILEEKAGT